MNLSLNSTARLALATLALGAFSSSVLALDVWEHALLDHTDNAYLLTWSVGLWFGWTMINIPYYAWGAEFSDSYHERTRIFGFRQLMGGAGLLLGMLSFYGLATAVKCLVASR